MVWDLTDQPGKFSYGSSTRKWVTSWHELWCCITGQVEYIFTYESSFMFLIICPTVRAMGTHSNSGGFHGFLTLSKRWLKEARAWLAVDPEVCNMQDDWGWRPGVTYSWTWTGKEDRQLWVSPDLTPFFLPCAPRVRELTLGCGRRWMGSGSPLVFGIRLQPCLDKGSWIALEQLELLCSNSELGQHLLFTWYSVIFCPAWN